MWPISCLATLNVALAWNVYVLVEVVGDKLSLQLGQSRQDLLRHSGLSMLQADARAPNSEPLKWALSADSEALTWAPHEPTTFLVSFVLYKSASPMR